MPQPPAGVVPLAAFNRLMETRTTIWFFAVFGGIEDWISIFVDWPEGIQGRRHLYWQLATTPPMVWRQQRRPQAGHGVAHY